MIGKSKALKKSADDVELFCQIVKQICPYLNRKLQINASTLASTLLGSKQYDLFSEILSPISDNLPSASAEFLTVFSLNFDSSLTALSMTEFLSGLIIISKFKQISPELEYKVKDETNFLKMVLLVFFSDEQLLTTPILSEIS